MNSVTQAVILAGGQGMRLRPLTEHIPKPMILVNGRPFLEHLVDLLRENGIRDIVMLLGYLPEKVVEYFGDGKGFGVTIRYSIGNTENLTGTRVRDAKALINDCFLLLYSDNYWPLQLEKLTMFYEEKKTLGTLVAYSNRYGDAEHGKENNLCVEADGRVSYYGTFGSKNNLNAVDIGFFVLNKKIFSLMPDRENFSFEHTILPKLISQSALAAYVTDHPYYAITTMDQIPTVEKFLTPKKVIFLDRDGVINKQMPPHEHVLRWEEFKFLPGVLNALRELTRGGYQIYIITNQRGIARGLMPENDLREIHKRMTKEIEGCGGKITDIYYCSHEKDENCFCRKPKPGMFFQAAREHRINLTKSIFIGDSESDKEAGEIVGCKIMILNHGETLQSVIKSLK